MDAVTLGISQVYTRKQDRALRRRAMPGPAGVPTVMASPPTVTASASYTAGTQESSSGIASAKWIRPGIGGAFAYSGTAVLNGLAVGGSIPSVTAASVYTKGSNPPFAADFLLDTVGGAFDILTRDNDHNKVRVSIDGQFVTAGATLKNTANTGVPMRGTISGLSAGVHRVRLEFGINTYFCGVVVGPTDRVSAVRPFGSNLRGIVIGDSFTEPTVQDTSASNTYLGFPQHLSYLMGCDVWSCGSGGTGYLNPSTGGKVKFRDRLATDVYPFAPDFVIWAGGINDYGGYTASAIQTEVAACFAAVSANLPNCQQIALSPFWPRDHRTFSNNLLATADAISTAATAASIPYVELLRLPVDSMASTYPAGVLSSSSSVSATSISSSVSFPVGENIQIDTGQYAEVRQVQSVSGTGPYTIGVNDSGNALANAHSAGATVQRVGRAHVTGTGRQGATQNDGTADRYTGNDLTHPTMAGHVAIAEHIYWGLQRVLPG